MTFHTNDHRDRSIVTIIINTELNDLRIIICLRKSGPGCPKLTMSLVNVSLKFQTLISNICQYFLLKNVRSFCSAKASLIFSTKISVGLVIKW